MSQVDGIEVIEEVEQDLIELSSLELERVAGAHNTGNHPYWVS
jgi:hypothetical protein